MSLETNTYDSATKGTMFIKDMESNHLKNAIAKLEKLRDLNQPYPADVLENLKAERDFRYPPAEPPKNMQASTPSLSPEMAELVALICNALNTKVSTLLSSDVVKPDSLEAKLRSLTDTVNNLGAPEPAVASTEPSVHPAIETLPGMAGLKTLVKSLNSYGVYTLHDLVELSPADFGAVRFSTAEAFIILSAALHQAGKNWNTVSTILSVDGYINRVLNPNASSIDLFVGQCERRLDVVVNGRHKDTNTAVYTKQIQRIFDGIKRRISLAVSVAGTALFARGYTAETASPIIAQFNNSQPFKLQVTLYLARVTQRVTRSNMFRDVSSPAQDPAPVTV